MSEKPPPPPSFTVGSKRKKKWDKVDTSKVDSKNTTNGNKPNKFQGISSSSYNSSNYVAKSKCGFSGLSNQGMTCYLNSLIQTLYMLPEVRSLLYKWKYDKKLHGKEERSIPLQLQKIFARLQLSSKQAVKTKNLTTSFGWEGRDSFVQHDVQELCRVLFEALDKTLVPKEQRNEKNTPISDLFRGKLLDYIKTASEEQGKSFKREHFADYLDLQLDVKGSKSIEESLERFIEPELLVKDNQWRCEALGNIKVDAVKGFKYVAFPYVLTLQLKRFDYDQRTWRRIKLSNKIEFPQILDVSKYGEKIKYELFSVLIHRGSGFGGHYYAYIKSFETGKFYNFNDNEVSEITMEEIKEMYGGKETISGYRKTANSTNAYMLLYRKIDPKKNIKIVSPSEIPKELRELVEKENQEYMKKREKFKIEQSMLTIKVYYKNDPCLAYISREESIKQATKRVYEKLKEEKTWENHNLEDVRLRDVDIFKKVPGRTFVGRENDKVENFKWAAYKSLMLDVKKPGEPWKDEVNQFQIYILFLNPITAEFEIPRKVKVNADSTLCDAKKQISAYLETAVDDDKKLVYPNMKYPHDRLAIVKYSFNSSKLLIGDSNLFEKDLGVTEGNALYVQLVAEGKKYPEENDILDKLEKEKNEFNINFNFPGQKVLYENLIVIDKRKTLKILKIEISKKIGLKIDEFRMEKKSRKIPYKDLNMTVNDSDLFDGAQVWIEKGRSIREDETFVKIYLYTPKTYEPKSSKETIPEKIQKSKDDSELIKKDNRETPLQKFKRKKASFALLGSYLIEDKTTLDELKEKLALELNLDKKLIRMRVKFHMRLGNPLVHSNKTLKENYSKFTHGTQLICQMLQKEEKLVDGDIILRVQRWYPSEWKFDEIQEIIVNRKTCWNSSQLKVLLEKIYNIEKVSFAKPPIGFEFWSKQACGEIPLLQWELKSDQLSAGPFNINDHVLLLWKNSDEKEKIALDILAKDHHRYEVHAQEKEKALKIITDYEDDEQEKQEEKKK